MKKKYALIALLAVLVIGAALWFALKPKRVYAVYGNSQVGIIVGSAEEIEVNGIKVPVYRTTAEPVKILFESRNLESDYRNEIIINGKYAIPLVAKQYSHTSFLENEIAIIGPNIVSGKLEITFRTGEKLTGNLNTFSIRNVRIQVSGREIWSEEYPEKEALNEAINLGEGDMNPAVRSNYRESVTFTFNVEEKLLKEYGAVLEDADLEEFIVTEKGRTRTVKNAAYIGIDCNIAAGEVLAETRKLEIRADGDILVKMDGIPIPSDLRLSRKGWAEGEHDLEITAVNGYGFSKTEKFSFSLLGAPIAEGNLSYRVYKAGSAPLSSSISDLGSEITDLSPFLEEDGIYDTVPFTAEPAVNFVVNKGDDTVLVWKGKVNAGRTAFMQIYDFHESRWETVSTAKAETDETLVLAFDYSGYEEYVSDGLLYVRVSSALADYSALAFSDRIVHATDIQYITRMISSSTEGTAVWKFAKAAFDAMVEFLLEEKQSRLRYLLYTGDFVQQQKGPTPEEWENVKTYLFAPLLEAGLPMGVSTGNHDVGAISSFNPDGSNALDSDLVYDYFWEHFGEDVFKDFPHYGDSFQNNRSHYDLVTIGGHEFLFLYLGWGSSLPYVHVSGQDIAWAKTVLDANPDKTVIIATHEYLNRSGKRTITGEKVYTELVKEYANVRFVFSGHLNGSAKRVDYIDDDGDGIYDREVLQLLTNFQEDESLFGATFFRTIDFDFQNNLLRFGIYSPYYRDGDLWLEEDDSNYRESREFYYFFDLNKSGFSILTDYFG